ncbi:unnamed protein product [Mytilus coruscus]|uniref:TRIM2_3 n=1 Tax=Mytilus coruscus TaxID=42192 RepID=A0A6J8DE41_MYTCO|nr:unnamed protein product [Mytilus coruscus]
MSDINIFGEVHIEARPYNIVLVKNKAKQTQMMIQTAQSRSIENIKLTLHKTIDTQGERTYGCCMLPDGRMAFTFCYDQTVKVFSDNKLKDFGVKLPADAFDLVYISKDNTLAVTSGLSFNQCITIIDLERKEIKKTISLDLFNYGIAQKDNRLIYSDNDKGIRMINLYDESTSDIVRQKMPRYCYIATFRDKIYHTNTETNNVTCYNLQGQLQWRFQNESVLNYPQGIDVDNNGNVYMVGAIHTTL